MINRGELLACGAILLCYGASIKVIEMLYILVVVFVQQAFYGRCLFLGCFGGLGSG